MYTGISWVKLEREWVRNLEEQFRIQLDPKLYSFSISKQTSALENRPCFRYLICSEATRNCLFNYFVISWRHNQFPKQHGSVSIYTANFLPFLTTFVYTAYILAMFALMHTGKICAAIPAHRIKSSMKGSREKEEENRKAPRGYMYYT